MNGTCDVIRSSIGHTSTIIKQFVSKSCSIVHHSSAVDPVCALATSPCDLIHVFGEDKKKLRRRKDNTVYSVVALWIEKLPPPSIPARHRNRWCRSLGQGRKNVELPTKRLRGIKWGGTEVCVCFDLILTRFMLFSRSHVYV